jgi:hypothetical protein
MNYKAIDDKLLNRHIQIRTISGHLYIGKFDQLHDDYILINREHISETRIAIEYIESMGPQ